MERNRTNPPPFLEMAVLEAEPVYRGAKGERAVDIKLVTFLPSLAEVPTKELQALKERAVKSGFDFIDFWAIDFDWHSEKPFNADQLGSHGAATSPRSRVTVILLAEDPSVLCISGRNTLQIQGGRADRSVLEDEALRGCANPSEPFTARQQSRLVAGPSHSGNRNVTAKRAPTPSGPPAALCAQ